MRWIWFILTRLLIVHVSLCFCCDVWEQEAAPVAVSPVPKAASVTAPDPEHDEPKDTEVEETVSRHWQSHNYRILKWC